MPLFLQRSDHMDSESEDKFMKFLLGLIELIESFVDPKVDDVIEAEITTESPELEEMLPVAPVTEEPIIESEPEVIPVEEDNEKIEEAEPVDTTEPEPEEEVRQGRSCRMCGIKDEVVSEEPNMSGDGTTQVVKCKACGAFKGLA